MESSNSGNMFISYKYYLDDRTAVGITTGFQTIRGSVYYYDGVKEDNFNLINWSLD